jgi:short-subunit dehydrogenase
MDKVVVITGASAGIGAALAERLAAEGANVVLVARRRAELQAVAERCKGRADVVVADVTQRDAVRMVVREAIARCGRVDVWVNNAGRGITRPASQLTDEDVDEMMRVNVMSALYGMQEVLPHFRERGTGQIVNVSSMLGRVPYAPHRSAYVGAKHFLNGLTGTFRAEVQATYPGIHVTLVSPGMVRTEFGNNARHGGADSRTMPNSQSAEEVAAVIADVIANPRPDVYTRAGAKGMILKYYTETGSDP